ncbi:MAG: protein-glutamate O-methyltransferase CheR [Candidatus Sulfotelmatobacter sp.]|jgi:chemotaxis protein methyltransferase CheR
MELTAEQFSKLSKLIYRKLGLQFDEKKTYFLNKRVEQRIAGLGLKDADEYLFQLGYCDANGDEMQALANLITTNETYMFREFEQLAGFADVCLPELVAAKQKTTDRRIRIWCAGCSSGEEAYTLAIIIREVFPDSRNWDIKIVATDIDENVLKLARNAVYGERSVKGVPAVYSKHLIPSVTGFRIDPETARLVRVEKLNLHDQQQMKAMRGYDFVFCRNVLIYFDDESRRSVVNHFYDSLNPKGYIFLGHSESVGRITSAFHLKKAAGHLLYAKD